MSAPTYPKKSQCKVICEQHGDVLSDQEGEASDEIVADLIRREHLEDCPGPVEIYDEGELDFETAKELVERAEESNLTLDEVM